LEKARAQKSAATGGNQSENVAKPTAPTEQPNLSENVQRQVEKVSAHCSG
jgi:hypothetical protein